MRQEQGPVTLPWTGEDRGLGKADNSADQAPKRGAVQEFVTQYPPIQDHDAVGLVHGITAYSTALTQGAIAPATLTCSAWIHAGPAADMMTIETGMCPGSSHRHSTRALQSPSKGGAPKACLGALPAQACDHRYCTHVRLASNKLYLLITGTTALPYSHHRSQG